MSEWQGNVDWKKVAAAGYSCAVLRAGFGRSDTQKDKQFDTNYKNAKAAGVKIGVYWYSYAVDKADAVKEAKACLSVLKGKSLDLPVFFDMEESSMTKLGKTTLTTMAKAFCDEIIKGGYKAGVYSNPNWFTNYLNYAELRKIYPIWLAQYYKEAQLDCDIWQYTSEGKVNGISGNVDLNVIYNEGIVKQAETQKAVENFETAAMQALLITAYKLGIISTDVSVVDNKSNDKTNSAIKQMKKFLGLTEDTSVTLDFVKKTQGAIVAAFPLKGDYNGDGKLDLKDATAIQKKLAGIDE